MTYLTRPFFWFLFAVEPVALPLLAVDLFALYLMIFRERFEPRTLIFWVAIVLVVPFLGFALYLAFGSTLLSRHRFGHKSERDRIFMEVSASEHHSPMVDLLRQAGADICTAGNAVRLFWMRDAMGPEALEEMRSARTSINMMFRRMPLDSGELYDVLTERAANGVAVRVMTSSLGFGRTPGIRRLKDAGVSFTTFHNPLRALLSLRPADRNMRSMAVIDGRVAYQGRGAVVRVEGPAATRLELRFRADWLYGSGEDLGTDVPAPETAGGTPVQVVSDGPDGSGDSPMATAYTQIVSCARRRLHISTPYLLPNDELYSAIKLAVLSGVEVMLLLPRRGRHWYQSWNSLAASNPLMMAGVRVFFVDKAMSKCAMVADGSICCIGSGDYCGRALSNDFNTCCVVYSEEVSASMEERFRDELMDAVECLPEEYVRRSFADRVRIAVARFLMFLN